MVRFRSSLCFGVGLALCSAALLAQTTAPIDLPSSKQLSLPLPGSPLKTNSLPMSMAVSPDGRYAATLNGGYGTAEAHYDESVLVVDMGSGQPVDFQP